jgi:hypothetical protein
MTPSISEALKRTNTPRGEHSATPLADAIRQIPVSNEQESCRHGRYPDACPLCERFEKP